VNRRLGRGRRNQCPAGAASQHSDLLAPTLRRRSAARPTGHRTLPGSAAFGAAATVHARPGGPDHGGRLGAAGPTGIAPPSLLAGRDCAVDQAGDMVTTISVSNLWRLLHQDAMRPWYDRGWPFPHAPAVVAKASVILDLYQRSWQG